MKLWMIVPAAGCGTRMHSDVPKQYLSLNHKTILEHTLLCLLSYLRFEKIVVVLAEGDRYWPNLNFQNNPKILLTIGGGERSHSVLNGLNKLAGIADKMDWVLVHDAARPCLQHSDIDKLVNTLREHPIGGLLGAPLRDTVKQVDQNNQITATLDRKIIWQAFTPQMFRYGLLCTALQNAISTNQYVTDEAAAIELMGEVPVLVEGRRDNIKITEPGDLALAGFHLTHP
jgi:2-C-methyl-D-erythritol 4-phosphate cytidylyltransferase